MNAATEGYVVAALGGLRARVNQGPLHMLVNRQARWLTCIRERTVRLVHAKARNRSMAMKAGEDHRRAATSRHELTAIDSRGPVVA